ncbi:MAG: response regulator transcription factor [Oscillospiraceae bacterium]|nr:response regulator transcription factor [Oscillospiraceae bacterium]
MIRIAVCDDNDITLKNLESSISNAFAKFTDRYTVLKFSDGITLLHEHENNPFDVVFLDIDMPVISGFDIADNINKDSETFIVFLTTHDELVYSSIKFQPFRFIRKSYLQDELPEAVEALVNAYNKRMMSTKYKFQTKNGDVFLNLQKIIYIEIYGHWLKIYTDNGETIECYGSLTSLERQLAEFDFIRTHKSYLVNCRYIYSVQTKQIILDNKTAIPLSRYKAEDVRNKYQKYLRSTL